MPPHGDRCHGNLRLPVNNNVVTYSPSGLYLHHLRLHNTALTRFSIVMQRLLIYPLPLLSQRSKGQRLVEPITTNVAGTSGVTHFPDLKERGERNIYSLVPRPCQASCRLQYRKVAEGQIAPFPGAEEGEERAPGTHCLRMRMEFRGD